MGKNKYFQNGENDMVDEKGNAVRKMDTVSSAPISKENFLENQKDENDLFETILEYESDAEAYPYLVRGATLRCNCGSHSRKLNLPICHGVYAGSHPLVHECDCVVGDAENIPTFGVCSSSKNPQKKLFGDTVTLVSEMGEGNIKGCPCTPVIVGGRWINSHPHMLISENQAGAENLDPNSRTYFNAITTASFLVCAYSGLIEPQDAGHDGGEGVIAKKSEDNPNKLDPFEEERLFWDELWSGDYSDAEKSKKIDEFYGPGFSDVEKKSLEDQLKKELSSEDSVDEATQYVDIPQDGVFGTIMTYMGWHRITSKTSPQYKMLQDAKETKRYEISTPEYYGLIDGRISVATKPNIGGAFPVAVGDYINVTFTKSNGEETVYNCIIGDIKGADAPHPWGHQEGKCVVEIIYHDYSPPAGYNGNKNNPWGSGRVTRITKVGSYYSSK